MDKLTIQDGSIWQGSYGQPTVLAPNLSGLKFTITAGQQVNHGFTLTYYTLTDALSAEPMVSGRPSPLDAALKVIERLNALSELVT